MADIGKRGSKKLTKVESDLVDIKNALLNRKLPTTKTSTITKIKRVSVVKKTKSPTKKSTPTKTISKPTSEKRIGSTSNSTTIQFQNPTAPAQQANSTQPIIIPIVIPSNNGNNSNTVERIIEVEKNGYSHSQQAPIIINSPQPQTPIIQPVIQQPAQANQPSQPTPIVVNNQAPQTPSQPNPVIVNNQQPAQANQQPTPVVVNNQAPQTPSQPNPVIVNNQQPSQANQQSPIVVNNQAPQTPSQPNPVIVNNQQTTPNAQDQSAVNLNIQKNAPLQKNKITKNTISTSLNWIQFIICTIIGLLLAVIFILNFFGLGSICEKILSFLTIKKNEEDSGNVVIEANSIVKILFLPINLIFGLFVGKFAFSNWDNGIFSYETFWDTEKEQTFSIIIVIIFLVCILLIASTFLFYVLNTKMLYFIFQTISIVAACLILLPLVIFPIINLLWSLLTANKKTNNKV